MSRPLIKTSLTLFVFCFFTSLSLAASCSGPANKQGGLVVVSSNNPAFLSYVANSFPELLHTAHFEEIRPFLTVVCNADQQAVVAYALDWTITQSNGSRRSGLVKHFVHDPDKNMWISGQKIQLYPGDLQLVSPLFAWTLGGYSALAHHKNDVEDTLQITLADLRKKYPILAGASAGERITASLDGAVFSDATFSGPNSSRLFQTFSLTRNAEHDEGVSVSNLLDSGKSNDEILNVLQFHIAKGRQPFTAPDEATYHAARGREAERMVSILKSDGRDTLSSVAHKLMGYPRMTLTKRVEAVSH